MRLGRGVLDCGMKDRCPWENIVAVALVGVFVASTLPWTAWVAEVDLDIGFHGECFMVGQFHSAIPGK